MFIMGHYDTKQTRKNKSRDGKKNGYFFIGIIGAMIGSITIGLTTPYIDEIKGGTGQSAKNNEVNQVTPVSHKPEGVNSLQNMIEDAKEVVVGVINYQKNSDPFAVQKQSEEAGSGSGVIYKKTGNKVFIVTNNHVIDGSNKIEVKLNNGKKLTAKVVGTDPLLDLAILEIDGTDVKKVATLGDSEKIRTGESVIAIGNPLGLEGSVTKGIISSKDRVIPVSTLGNQQVDWQAQVIQTDAAINPGNSGGALFNEQGEVIGINSSKIAQHAVEGIGFAIPINIAKTVLESLEKDGVVKRPMIGVQLFNVEEITNSARDQLKLPKQIINGVVLGSISNQSPAEKGGLQQHDVVIALDEQKIENVVQFRKYLYEKKKLGDTIKVTVYRNDEKITKMVKLTEQK
ncbi:S1C family serine protease [Bacillus sp. FDAARGOS_1420]|uniref:S1C family serine protease n=1 Tax=unclassified Bacillus (in: firmicutes) TaxID=185979 RepID=UPI001C5B5A21|nr:trypsin-like peptidase domain-containing protein [Bacillus sp. FDAARGOS_1420]MBW3496391.1 trypsin-like peptidase domain-containing protein [Bacillus sp. FDAARGOS_1420]